MSDKLSVMVGREEARTHRRGPDSVSLPCWSKVVFDTDISEDALQEGPIPAGFCLWYHWCGVFNLGKSLG